LFSNFEASINNDKMQQNKCVFLDRDGVLNEERGDYTYEIDDFVLVPGVIEALQLLKAADYLLVVVTNQAGIAKGLYTKQDMDACHEKLHQETNYILNAIYYAPQHPVISNSLARKPDSLMLERAIARFNIDPNQSWLVGDRLRDLEAGKKVGVKGILVGAEPAPVGILYAANLLRAAHLIIQK